MFAVGAMDAYCCDVYTDLVTRSIRAARVEPAIPIPPHVANIKASVGTLLEIERWATRPGARVNWRWRMLARRYMERKSVFGVKEIKELVNPFMAASPANLKLITTNSIEDWLDDSDSSSRLFSVQKRAFDALNAKEKGEARKNAVATLTRRIRAIAQRRHDCIHTCDTPRNSIQRITERDVRSVIEDLEYFVTRLEPRIEDGFGRGLASLGYAKTTLHKVGCGAAAVHVPRRPRRPRRAAAQPAQAAAAP